MMIILDWILAIRLISWIAFLCTVAGFVMMLLGYSLSRKQMDIQASLQSAIEQTNRTLELANEAIDRSAESSTTSGGVANSLQMQAATPVLSGSTEYVKGLAELAKNLGGLTPAVAAFIIATILFFFATILAATDIIVVL
jgi:hypothetical protein